MTGHRSDMGGVGGRIRKKQLMIPNLSLEIPNQSKKKVI